MNSQAYIGRFAPSPSGHLHLGSLVTALGSYLQAKAQQGKWRLRIDDIDPPRIMPGAIEHIQSALWVHGLKWDDEIVYQSDHSAEYESALQSLLANNKIYRCECTRAQIKAAGGRYAGTCRDKTSVSAPFSLRFKHTNPVSNLNDGYLGHITIDPSATNEDFIVKRKDGLYAYHLASVVDDIAMGVTEIVRGEDLLLPTACQWSLFHAFEAQPPKTMHLPLVAFKDGRKYSKQNNAPALDLTQPKQNLQHALGYLGIEITPQAAQMEVVPLLNWAITQWQQKSLPVSQPPLG
ncbi:tRNA glutamyl-Q(34) synthetase GluQRS [Aliiglaciecola litoralis]|uniref:Glutamyl-Q tRNA(Asp) synthetase n=1 Tax=Aliiglaciecola litoralis TaxID=582857 RepID=A0ABN1LEH3_9ALTE